MSVRSWFWLARARNRCAGMQREAPCYAYADVEQGKMSVQFRAISDAANPNASACEAQNRAASAVELSLKEGFALLAQGWLALADQVDWVERRCGQFLEQEKHDPI